MQHYKLPKELFDTAELTLAVNKFEQDGDYNVKPLVLGLKQYMHDIDPTLDTYDPSRQLIAALKMRNAEFLRESWENWLAIMAIHGVTA